MAAPCAKLSYSQSLRTTSRVARPPSKPLTLAVHASTHTVVLQLPNGKQHSFRASSSGDSLYDLAAYAGVVLPASCKQGSCTACCAKVLSGKVSTKGQTCIPPGLQKEGYIAMCCAHPQSDVTILTHQGAAVRAKRREEQMAQYK